jgi:hypothetical protein
LCCFSQGSRSRQSRRFQVARDGACPRCRHQSGTRSLSVKLSAGHAGEDPQADHGGQQELDKLLVLRSNEEAALADL